MRIKQHFVKPVANESIVLIPETVKVNIDECLVFIRGILQQPDVNFFPISYNDVLVALNFPGEEIDEDMIVTIVEVVA